jgi:hypothetical protein
MSQDLPTYGRGDDTPEEPRQSPAVPPAQPYADAPPIGEQENGSAPQEPGVGQNGSAPQETAADQPSYDAPQAARTAPPAESSPRGGSSQPPAGMDDLPHYGPGVPASAEPPRYAQPQPGAYGGPPYGDQQYGAQQYGGQQGAQQHGGQQQYGGQYYGGQPYGQPYQYGGQGQPQFGQQPYGSSYPQGPQFGYGSPYGQGQYGDQYGQTPAQPLQATKPEPNPTAARIALVGGIVAAFYGLLMMTVQRRALREIAQAPGSDLNHPLRTDVIDTIFQLSVAALTGVVLFLWLRDLLERRRAGRQPATAEIVGLGLIGSAGLFGLIWFGIIASTGFGSNDELTGRLPAAYSYGGLGLLLLAAGLFIGYRLFRTDPATVVQSAPARPPWE